MAEREPQLQDHVTTPEGPGVVVARAQIALGRRRGLTWRLRVALDGGGYWAGFATELGGKPGKASSRVSRRP